MMSKEDMIKLADYLAHMQAINRELYHVPEMRQHVDFLKKSEDGLRELAEGMK